MTTVSVGLMAVAGQKTKVAFQNGMNPVFCPKTCHRALGGLHSTEDAILIHTQQPCVRIPVPIFFSLC